MNKLNIVNMVNGVKGEKPEPTGCLALDVAIFTAITEFMERSS
jgi:hypothetical protein